MKEQTTLDGSEYIPTTSDDWETPKELFDRLHKQYKFTLDVCCKPETAKCEKYFTIEDDGLKQSWSNEIVWMNPPFSNISEWVKRAHYDHIRIDRAQWVIGLLPAWTDRDWFHDHVYGKANIEFLRGRVRFLLNGKEYKSPRFGCMVVVWQ